MSQLKRREFLKESIVGIIGASLIAPAKKPTKLMREAKMDKEETDVLVKVLGTAQDGGLPQAGCYCKNCIRARKEKGFSRLVSSLAVLDLREKKFFLLDATPNLPAQVDMAFERLALEKQVLKNSPQAVLITHAHIGHYAGLIFFGYEVMSTSRLPVYCSSRMSRFLTENGPWSQLVRLENISLHTLAPDEEFSLSAQVSFTAFSVPHRDEYSDTLGFIIAGKKKKLLYIPDIQSWEAWKRPIAEVAKGADIALLDGTFFSSEELPGRNLFQIGHPLIQSSLKALKDLAAKAKKEIYFTHLNHTNLALDAEGEARKEVERQGLRIASDGMEFYI